MTTSLSLPLEDPAALHAGDSVLLGGSRCLMRAHGGALPYKHASDMSIGKHLSVSLMLGTTRNSSTPLFRETMTYYPRSHTQTNYIMFNRTINISCMLVSIMISYL